MIIFAKENPIGVDAIINSIQQLLDTKFSTSWQGLECYPRCYVNEDKGKQVIEHFDGKDYNNVVHADKSKCFFLAEYDEIPNGSNNYSTVIEIFFIVDLKKAKPSILHRADGEIRNEVLSIIEKIPNTTIKRVVKKAENIFKGYFYDNVDDLHPTHCFKVVLSLDLYKRDQTICKII